MQTVIKTIRRKGRKIYLPNKKISLICINYFPHLDTEDPVINNLPANIKASTDSGIATATVFWSPPVAVDNSNVHTLTSSHVPGDSFPIGNTTVTYTATDRSGNMVTEEFNVDVEGLVLFLISKIINNK